MDRRKFIKTGSLFAFAVSTVGCVVSQPTKENPSAFKGDCTTTDDILGPFYRAGAPIRNDITTSAFKEEKISIKGVVYQGDCKTPLEGALVEFWQADPNGEYDNETEDFLFRGRLIADENGQYEFKTFSPGRYLNGSTYRPKHIHFRVRGADHKELISQIYFKGDPYIDKDPWASDPKAELRVLPLENENGIETIVFNIFLSGV